MKDNCVYAMMYSGRQNPEKELTSEELETIQDLLSQLKEPWLGPSHPRLGFTGYGATYELDGWIQSCQADISGFVHKWDKDTNEWDVFADTSGVLPYLMKIMVPTMQEHYKEGYASYNSFNKDPQSWVAPETCQECGYYHPGGTCLDS